MPLWYCIVMNIIGERIKERIKERAITQKEVAQMLDVEPNTFTRWANGNRTPDIETLKKIARILNTTVAYLIGETDAEVTEPTIPSYSAYIPDDLHGEEALSYGTVKLRESIRRAYPMLCQQDRLIIKTALQAALADINDIELREKNSTITEQPAKTA